MKSQILAPISLAALVLAVSLCAGPAALAQDQPAPSSTVTPLRGAPFERPLGGADELPAAPAVAPAESQPSGQPPAEEGGGLLSRLLSPLRATIRCAKNFFGQRADDVRKGADWLQREQFAVFMRLYNKSYSPEELPRRLKLFLDRRDMIRQSLEEFRAGRLPFVMRENPFIDWDEEELKMLAGVSLPAPADLDPDERRSLEGADNTTSATTDGEPGADDGPLVVGAERVPAEKDWRTSGCVAAPLNQMKCGACYAIATVGVVETMRCLNQVSSPILAPQQAVDCSRAYGNHGCDGGWPTRVLKYLQDASILARETCYPFVRRQNWCKLASVRGQEGCTVAASPTDKRQLSYKVLNNERDILYHVAKTGPVATVMRATDAFLYYGSGVFDDRKCSRRRDDVDHAIVIVGYGRENGQDYWLIKNSWGVREWGEEGYGKFKRGTNACSIGHWGWVVTS